MAEYTNGAMAFPSSAVLGVCGHNGCTRARFPSASRIHTNGQAPCGSARRPARQRRQPPVGCDRGAGGAAGRRPAPGLGRVPRGRVVRTTGRWPGRCRIGQRGPRGGGPGGRGPFGAGEPRPTQPRGRGCGAGAPRGAPAGAVARGVAPPPRADPPSAAAAPRCTRRRARRPSPGRRTADRSCRPLQGGRQLHGHHHARHQAARAPDGARLGPGGDRRGARRPPLPGLG